ncbi:deoxyuridine 5'-triphosphate nucleotidohydrolase [Halorubrum sp. JWXQ-INN 858]|uniref:deoxyuridine 5'-triphosphate nucleotidohydrolase n=1 Tax=Halorubrum sp. JWXQ-INN 858 TaxID=2690782 RepID=UPI00135BD6BF|nr:deoxyuridine 5'-triphosphate nucleotidohydrolase [Halorubrum sp. JWXQ-INN 858]MWV65997.1 deoxyuridine 5'-triphosphate nucleotidohydrolase [Halorubrum sp. JWXQ-INN 858]
MYESGTFVAAALEAAGADLDDAQRQPNGVDLTVDAAFEPVEPGRIGRDAKRVGKRRELSPADGTYRLDPGSYVVRYGEPVRIPEGHVGFVYPRSTLLRNAAMLNTAVWDAGYEGVGEGLLRVGHPIEIEPGARIAQLVLARADHDGTYDGDYQGEGV